MDFCGAQDCKKGMEDESIGWMLELYPHWAVPESNAVEGVFTFDLARSQGYVQGNPSCMR